MAGNPLNTEKCAGDKPSDYDSSWTSETCKTSECTSTDTEGTGTDTEGTGTEAGLAQVEGEKIDAIEELAQMEGYWTDSLSSILDKTTEFASDAYDTVKEAASDAYDTLEEYWNKLPQEEGEKNDAIEELAQVEVGAVYDYWAPENCTPGFYC